MKQNDMALNVTWILRRGNTSI